MLTRRNIANKTTYEANGLRVGIFSTQLQGAYPHVAKLLVQ